MEPNDGLWKLQQKLEQMRKATEFPSVVNDLLQQREIFDFRNKLLESASWADSITKQYEGMPAWLEKTNAIWVEPAVGAWSNNLFQTLDLEFHSKHWKLQELINGITIARVSNPHFTSVVTQFINKFDKAIALNEFAFKSMDFEVAALLQKQSRIIKSHLIDPADYFKIDYDLSSVATEEAEQGQIITPSLLITEARKIKKVIQEIYRNNLHLSNISPRQFEELVAELLQQKGYEVELTKQTRDGGRDLIALKDDNGFPLKYLVECKKYRKDRKVGVDIIRSFSDVVRTESANKGIIFTTSYFTNDARQRQKMNPFLLDLKDHDEVVNWVKDYIVGR